VRPSLRLGLWISFRTSFDLVATGVGLFQHSDTNPYVRGRILLDNAISSDFSVNVKVKEADANQNPTSSAATQFGSLRSTYQLCVCHYLAIRQVELKLCVSAA
jgi:hypothetical protein